MAYYANSEALNAAATAFGSALKAYDEARANFDTAVETGLSGWTGASADAMTAIKDSIKGELDKVSANLASCQKIFEQSATDNDETEKALAAAINGAL